MFDSKQWGWIKLVGGAVAFVFAWQNHDALAANLSTAVLLLAAFTFLAGVRKVSWKGK